MMKSGSILYTITTLCLLYALPQQMAARQVINVRATTPSLNTSNTTPNTVIVAAGNSIATSLLASGAPALLWGSVPSAAVNAVCLLILNTGSFNVPMHVTGDWDTIEDLDLRVLATDGCLAEEDGSGTQFLFLDNYGRRSALVCPTSGAGDTGCGVYMTGDDITYLYNSYSESDVHAAVPKIRSSSTHDHDDDSKRLKLLSLPRVGDPVEANVTAYVIGIMTAADCLNLGSLAPFCVPGELGVHAVLNRNADCTCTGDGCVCCTGDCSTSCFPGDAIVQTSDGGTKPMSQLEIGDQVAVWQPDRGIITYQEVYAFGHKDANAAAAFLEITVEPVLATAPIAAINSSVLITTLTLSPMHFIPTIMGTSSSFLSGSNSLYYKRAKDVQVGDIVWASPYASSSSSKARHLTVVPCVVKDISTTWTRHGLYNPFTMGGTIVVDGVVASVHSDWFLDSLFESMGLIHWLPSIYQLLLTPVRMLYSVMGRSLYISTYQFLDARLDVAEFGTKYGAHVAVCATTTASFGLLITLLLMQKHGIITAT